MKSGVKFGHKMHTMRMCILGRYGPWRFGLTLTVTANRDAVKCPASARLLQIRRSEVHFLTPKGFRRGPLLHLVTLLVAQTQFRGYNGLEEENTVSFITHRCLYKPPTDEGDGYVPSSGERFSFPQALGGRQTCTSAHICMPMSAHAHTHAGSCCSQLQASLGSASSL